jgi:hypothetical protein
MAPIRMPAMSAWRKISMKVPSDVISCARGQPVGKIRN